MSCAHKFGKYLRLEGIDFEPETLVVGTFTPSWPANDAEWFYGNTAISCFWNVLPRLYGTPSLTNASPAEWRQFCHDNKIAVTDLISTIDDAEPGNREHIKMMTTYADKTIMYNFDDFEFVNIAQLLRQYPGIKNVYLTRGITESFWRHLWNPVVQYCSLHNIRERKLLTASAEASYQHEAYNIEHPEGAIPLLEDYILMRWREDWHD